MKLCFAKHILFSALLLFIMVFIFPVIAVKANTCLTAGCHGEMGKKQFVHSPVEEGECLTCHRQERQTHPSGQKGDFVLAASPGKLCFECHSVQGFSFDYQHGPASSGACITCHDPHDSEQKSLLKMPLQQMCLSCHNDFALSMQEAAHLHSAITELDCAACHRPHGSDKSKLLKGESIELCFSCHENMRSYYDSSLSKHKALYIRQNCGNCHLAHFSNYPSLLLKQGDELCFDCHGEDDSSRSDALRNIRKEIEGKEYVHGPVAEGDCVQCHDPHGSSYAKILTGAMPQAFYAPYDQDEYDFCFQCHDKGLLTAQTTGDQTDFRNGTENLHYRHVARKQKGRTCRSCHSIHASNGQKLINPDGIAFGNWKIPIRFEATETGGGCVPGCHRAMTYDRNAYVDNSPQVDTEKKERKVVYTPPSPSK